MLYTADTLDELNDIGLVQALIPVNPFIIAFAVSSDVLEHRHIVGSQVITGIQEEREDRFSRRNGARYVNGPCGFT